MGLNTTYTMLIVKLSQSMVHFAAKTRRKYQSETRQPLECAGPALVSRQRCILVDDIKLGAKLVQIEELIPECVAYL